MSSPNDTNVDEPESLPVLDSLDSFRAYREVLTRHLVREIVGEQIQLDVDIDQQIREIMALLTINDEIFARCMLNSASTGVKTKLTRMGFERVKTRQDGTKLELITQPERVDKVFKTEPLATVPFQPPFVVEHKKAPFSKCIDFRSFFMQVMLLLHEDYLKYLLPIIKDHLEKILVCLGEMDEWAMQVTKNALFIKETFGKELEAPVDVDPKSKTDKCCYCNGDCGRKKCRTKHILSECTNVSGSHDIVFEITEESERAKMERFMHFVWG